MLPGAWSRWHQTSNHEHVSGNRRDSARDRPTAFFSTFYHMVLAGTPSNDTKQPHTVSRPAKRARQSEVSMGADVSAPGACWARLSSTSSNLWHSAWQASWQAGKLASSWDGVRKRNFSDQRAASRYMQATRPHMPICLVSWCRPGAAPSRFVRRLLVML